MSSDPKRPHGGYSASDFGHEPAKMSFYVARQRAQTTAEWVMAPPSDGPNRREDPIATRDEAVARIISADEQAQRQAQYGLRTKAFSGEHLSPEDVVDLASDPILGETIIELATERAAALELSRCETQLKIDNMIEKSLEMSPAARVGPSPREIDLARRALDEDAWIVDFVESQSSHGEGWTPVELSQVFGQPHYIDTPTV
jgi:hypothetical protein